MSEDFDQWNQRYRSEVEQSIRFSGKGHEFFLKSKARYLLELANDLKLPLHQIEALDIGCGTGLFDQQIAGVFGRLEGVDPSEQAVAQARSRNPLATYSRGDGTQLAFANDTFDLAFAVCVLHHVEPTQWGQFLTEMRRVVRPGGLLVIFEHNPYNPLTLLAVDRCAFDLGAHLLSLARLRQEAKKVGLLDFQSRFLLFTPWEHRWVQRVEKKLGWLPLGAQYGWSARKANT